MEEIIIKEEFPLLKYAKEVFGEIPNTVVFAYNGKIYNKHDNFVNPYLLAHEMVHIKRQNDFIGGPDGWWKEYLYNKDFRLVEEVLAYKEQYKKFCEEMASKNTRFNYLMSLAKQLSSDLYGNLCSTSTALKLISRQ